MPHKPKPKPDNLEQFKRFIEIAREVGADERPDAIDHVLRKISAKMRLPKHSSQKSR
jgi:hypothetical protein